MKREIQKKRRKVCYRIYDGNRGEYVDPSEFHRLPVGFSRDGELCVPRGFIIQQYTDTVDENKVPIYEGDICDVDISTEIGVVQKRGVMEWVPRNGGFTVQLDDNVLGVGGGFNISRIRLIGQAFLHPELLRFEPDGTPKEKKGQE